LRSPRHQVAVLDGRLAETARKDGFELTEVAMDGDRGPTLRPSASPAGMTRGTLEQTPVLSQSSDE
jgi:hypothetical protein